jgi:flavin reductase (DIM6/NTAB) family NADH-FMN oxidoreductase RutF/DNA-binding transcriptional LysR family regulator
VSDPTTLRQNFLEGMSQAACTVNIVTTDGPAGRIGVTVSAMSSVSADSTKPSLLVCVHQKSGAAEAIQRNGVFCVNVLRDDQADVSDTFAGRIKTADGDKFSAGRWTTQVTGAPRIVDPLVAFDCRLAQSLRYGSHHVFFGEVEDIFVQSGGHPLIYANRAYGRAARIEPRLQPAPADGQSLTIGALVTLAPYVVPELVRRLLDAMPGLKITLLEAPQTALVEALKSGAADVALTYGFQLDPAFETEILTEMPAYVLLPEAHRLSHQRAVALADLAVEPMILLDLPMSREYFLGLFEAAGATPRIALRSTSFETVRGLVGQGLGFALLGTKPANGVTYDGMALVTRPLAGGSPASEIVLARASGQPERAAVSQLQRICRDWLRPAGQM